MALEVLYEDNHLLAVNKPAGLPTMGAAAAEPSLLQAAKEYIRQRYRKPGNVYLGTVMRLDAPVTGVTLFARTSKAAARLAAQFRGREVEKTYWAIVAGCPRPPRAELADWLVKDERHRRMHVARPGEHGAQEARMIYQVLHSYAEHALLQVELKTGRKHQIRLQLAARKHPVVGDRKYGSTEAFPAGIALHARRLVIVHPTLHTPVVITAPLPHSWSRWVPAALEAQLG